MSHLWCGPEALAQSRSANMQAASNESTSTLRDTLKWVWAARRGIPSRTNWKQQQLVMQSISRGRSLQLPTFPQSQGKARRKPDHPFQPTRKPAVPGTPWEAVSAKSLSTGIIQLTGRRNLLCFPRTLQDPADRRAGRRPMPSTIPTAINKKFYEKTRENLRIQDSKPHASVVCGSWSRH